jgi:hypothetical protein
MENNFLRSISKPNLPKSLFGKYQIYTIQSIIKKCFPFISRSEYSNSCGLDHSVKN